jgi:hypothetical protein
MMLHGSRKRLHSDSFFGILQLRRRTRGVGAFLQNLLLWWILKRNPKRLRFFLRRSTASRTL